MNRHTLCVIASLVVIVGSFVYTGWNVYAAEQLQFRITDREGFNYFDIVNGDKVSVCNPLPFFVNFKEFDMVMIYEGQEKGIFSIPGTTLPPLSSLELEGRFSSNTFEETQYLALHFDGMYSGSTDIRIDPTKLTINTKAETPIIGVIPFSVTNQYGGFDFYNKMNNDDFKC